MPRSLHDLTFDQLRELIVAEGLRPAHAGTLWNTLHFKAMADPLDARLCCHHCANGSRR